MPAAGRSTRSRRSDLKRHLLLVALGLVLGWGIAVTVLFGVPHTATPEHADAVVVLAGARGPRLHRGLELMQRRVAPVLVVSDGWDPLWPEANRLCAGRATGFRVVCFRPEPYNTRGEARGVRRLARRLGWHDVVVVTSTYHVTRARMLFERCLDGSVAVTGADYPVLDLPAALAGETAKLAWAVAVRRSC
jgi:uncharacterized SAM-binding protein YcdF (DUF218 family)